MGREYTTGAGRRPRKELYGDNEIPRRRVLAFADQPHSLVGTDHYIVKARRIKEEKERAVAVSSRLQNKKARNGLRKAPQYRLRVRQQPDNDVAPEGGQAAQNQETESAQDTAFILRQKAAEARAKFLELCRADVNTFIEYVMADDLTGDSVTQSPFHEQVQGDLDKHGQVVVMSHPDSGKTNQLIGRLLHKIGRNPNIRAMWLANAEDSAMKTLATARRYIEDSERLHEVFPNLKRGDTWKDDSIIVQRTNYSRDPTVTAVGYNSRRIQGSRVDFLVIDDLLDSLVTATEQQRRKISSWVKNTVFTRLTENAEVAFLTNAWHPRDLAHELVRDRGWHLIKRPIRNPDGQIWWHRWSEDRLKLIRKSLGALEYARSYECDPRDDESRIFRPEHVEHALLRGRGYGFVKKMKRYMLPGTIIVTGVDLATQGDNNVRKPQGAKTVITSVFFHPNQDRQVIRIRAGRWRATQIIEELKRVSDIFPNNHWIVVENNGVQRWILDLAAENDMDVGVALIPFQTGRNKTDPVFGVASMAAEFEGLRWILPNDCESEEDQAHVEALVSQAIDYVPESHTGDYLMSLWFAREIGRKIFKRRSNATEASEGSTVRLIGAA